MSKKPGSQSYTWIWVRHHDARGMIKRHSLKMNIRLTAKCRGLVPEIASKGFTASEKDNLDYIEEHERTDNRKDAFGTAGSFLGNKKNK